MASQETVTEVVSMLFRSPLANKPKPLPGETEAAMIKNTIRIFHMALQDIDDDLLQAATIQHLTTEKWFPSIADLRGAAVGLMQRADDVPDAYTAWGQVKRAAQSGNYRIVAYTDDNGELAYRERGGVEVHPLTQKAINALGGIKEFAMASLDDEGQWRARFIMAYEGYQRRAVDDIMTLPQIAAYVERRKELNGNSVQSLVAVLATKLSMNSKE